jgi:hypothetical protein
MNEILYELIKMQPVSDTHEHIISSSELAKHSRGLLELIGEAYLHDDIISAGADEDIFSPGHGDEKRWDLLKPYLDCVRNTTYYRCLIHALNDLFDLHIREIDDSNWKDLNALLQDRAKEGASWYEKVLHEKANIRYCMLDMDRTSNTEVGLWQGKGLKSIRDNTFEEQFFTRAARTDLMLNIVFPEARKEIEEIYGVSVRDLDGIDALVDSFVKRADKNKTVCYKSVAAYFRSLTIEECTREEARKAFTCVQSGTASYGDRMKVQNYILHSVIAQARLRDMPFQFHTGMQALNANTIDNSNPLRLNPLFLKYPEVRFILLHGGYPYCGEAGVLAKKFPNVYLDFSWLPQIGYTAAKHAAGEWFDLVPMNKITWGGDCRHVENSYSAVLLFRKLMYEVLEEKLENDILNMETAIEMIDRIMYNNAVKIYKLR